MKSLNILLTMYHAYDLLIRHGLRAFFHFYQSMFIFYRNIFNKSYNSHFIDNLFVLNVNKFKKDLYF